MLAISLDISLRQMCYETSTFILQHLDHPYHFVIEAFLIVFIFYIFFQRSYKEKTNKDTLTPGVSYYCFVTTFTPELVSKNVISHLLLVYIPFSIMIDICVGNRGIDRRMAARTFGG